MTSATITIRLDEQIRIRLVKLAEATHRSKSFLAAEAISDYLKVQEWQIREIKKGIAEADAGEYTSHNKVIKYWEKKRADSVDEES
jgi:RHH-type rel operon transcriptional repressor/antitoxin RelB